MLGIVIGIGSVSALISLGQASQQKVQSQNSIAWIEFATVSPGSQISNGVRGAIGGGQLNYADAKAIESSPKNYNNCKSSTGIFRQNTSCGGNSNTNTQIYGVTSAYTTVKKVPMSRGSFITDKMLF
jgi:putative ABC transport system permease protein